MGGGIEMRNIVAGVLAVSFLVIWGLGSPQSATSAQKPAAASAAKSAATGVPGWQKRWDETLAAAKKEGTLVIYGEVNPELEQKLRLFEQKYGIKMQVVFGKSNEIATRWERERVAGLNIVDVFHTAPVLGPYMKSKKGWGPLEPHFILPEVTDAKAWPDGRMPFLDSEKTIIVLNGAYTSYVAYNTDLVKEGQLKSYRDLLKPEWRGKIVFFDPTLMSASSGWTTFMMTDIYGLEGGKAYLRDFAATDPAIIKDARLIVEWVARGKYPIGVGTGHAIVSQFKASGAPIKMARFQEGGSINPGSGAIEISVTPPHPNAAAIYINWLLTDEGQTAAAQGMAAPPLRLGINVEGVDPDKRPQPKERFFITNETYFKTQSLAIDFAKEAFINQLGK